MSDPYILLQQLKHLQVKREELRCTCSSTCWCMKVSYKFPMSTGECMSPAEMLEIAGNELSKTDRQYLISLLGKQFVKE